MTVLRGVAPDRLSVVIGTKDPVEIVIVVVCRGPFGIIPPPPLCLEVLHRDVSLLDIPRITLWARGVCVTSSEPVLRGMSEQPLPKPNQALLPVAFVIQVLRHGEFFGLVESLLSGSSPPAHQDDHEDESASEGHEEDLPPLEPVRATLRGGGRVDAGDGG